MKSNSNKGYVYVLTSPNSRFIKLGGTGNPPMKRIKEINGSSPYREHDVWSLYDFRQVADWRLVEKSTHYAFRSKLVTSIASQRELFELSPKEAADYLETIDESLVIGKPKVDRLFQDEEFANFLMKLSRMSTIMNWLDYQGAWALSLFPSTAGGRYFTLNIGTHEVGYTSLGTKKNLPHHALHMDSLILNFPDTMKWVHGHGGDFSQNVYATSLGHSRTVHFYSSFDEAIEFLSLPGVRRAVKAYWTEALVNLQENAKLSLHSQHHNWNAVAELKRRLES